MPTFSYIIKNKSGVREEGLLTAESLDAALNKLYEKGSTVISITSAGESAYRTRESLSDRVAAAIYKMRTSVPLGRLVFFTRQLSTMFSAGLTLEKALTSLAKYEKNKRFKRVLGELERDVKTGQTLSEAMEKHPGVFSGLYCALVKSGELSGTLHTILEDLADYLETTEDTRRKVLSALFYPAFVVTFLVVVVAILIVWIVPMFERIYDRFGADLPIPTQILLFITHTITDNFVAAILVLVGIILALFLFSLSDMGRLLIDRIKLKFPITGGIVENAVVSRFARTFGILVGSGIPVVEGLGLLRRVVGNRVYELGVAQSQSLVRNGYTIAESLTKPGVFPPTLLQLVATGEETGEMNKLLMKAARFYEKLVDSAVSRLTTLIEPLLIIFTGIVVGSIIVVVYLPVFYLGMVIRRGVKGN